MLRWLFFQDLHVDRDAASLESLHDGVVGWDAVVVLLRLEWLYQYDISCIVVGKHDVLVAANCADWVASKVVSEECRKRYLPEEDCVGRCCHGVEELIGWEHVVAYVCGQ